MRGQTKCIMGNVKIANWEWFKICKITDLNSNCINTRLMRVLGITVLRITEGTVSALTSVNCWIFYSSQIKRAQLFKVGNCRLFADCQESFHKILASNFDSNFIVESLLMGKIQSFNCRF